MGRRADGSLVVASEMKALVRVCAHIEVFPPGHYMTKKDPKPVRYWTRDWFEVDGVPDREVDPREIHDALADAVHSHMMTDVPYGVLLSGGLDSSVIGALAAGFAAKRIESGDREAAWWPRLHSYAVGLSGSPDLVAAQRAADSIGTVHHSFEFTVQEGLDALRDVIWHIESFDTTSVRASTPMYLMARRIRATGVKMVLSGEGSDEIFGGYLYFHKAPSPQAFHEELVRKLHLLHLYDCLRANKSMAAWGIEARVPFLDTRFLDVAMRVPARHKMVAKGGGIEKRILREAFPGALPKEILWRQKEQFSDGVGYSWIDSLKAFAERRVSAGDMADAAERFPVGTPLTKEAYLYRAIFEELFPHPSAAACVPYFASVACSSPAAIAWDPSFANNADPSGRAVKGVHQNAL
jgi:asparagine synthase (glutamine-hydrolysing)